MHVAALFFILGLLLIEAMSKPTITNIDHVMEDFTAANLDDILALSQELNMNDRQEVDDDDDDDQNNSTIEDKTKETARTGLRVCLRLRLLRLMFRLFMLRASGMRSQELRQTTAAAMKALAESSDQVHQNMEASNDADLCKILCLLGPCPPGCPGENNPPIPPWGGKKR